MISCWIRSRFGAAKDLVTCPARCTHTQCGQADFDLVAVAFTPTYCPTERCLPMPCACWHIIAQTAIQPWGLVRAIWKRWWCQLAKTRAKGSALANIKRVWETVIAYFSLCGGMNLGLYFLMVSRSRADRMVHAPVTVGVEAKENYVAWSIKKHKKNTLFKY